jgi:putative SOS response-associated peptidase YedK
MFARYDNFIARDADARLYRAMRLLAWNFPPRYNIAPTDAISIVRVGSRDDTRELVLALEPSLPEVTQSCRCKWARWSSSA